LRPTEVEVLELSGVGMRRRLGDRIGLHLCPLRGIRLFLIKNCRDVRDCTRWHDELSALGDCLGYASQKQQPSTKDAEHALLGNARVVGGLARPVLL